MTLPVVGPTSHVGKTGLPGEQWQIPTEQDQKKTLGRVDMQAGARNHITVRSGYSRNFTNHSTAVL